MVWRHPGVAPATLREFPDLAVAKNFRSTPIMVNGVLYASNALGLVEAMDPASGTTIWAQAPVKPGIDGMRGVSGRTVAYWGNGTDQRVVSSRNGYLFALDAKTGKPVRSFGDNGVVDLTDGSGNQHFIWNAPAPIIVRDLIVLGADSRIQAAIPAREFCPATFVAMTSVPVSCGGSFIPSHGRANRNGHLA